MQRSSRIARFVGLALLLGMHLSSRASAADIPADAAAQPRMLWRLVMETYYGPYDNALKCWTARLEAEQVCMRPHRLDAVEIGGVKHLFLAIGGTKLADDGQPMQAHVDSGALGFIVLKENGASLTLVAKNGLHAAFGTFGAVPAEDAFAVREIGPDEAYGWVATDGWSGQGQLITSATIFAVVGDTVVSIGNFPNHYDNSGNCEDGKVIGSAVACTDYSAEILFDSTDRSGRYFPLIMRVAGTREGAILDQAFTTTFDAGKFSYAPIDGLPEEFANGI